MPYIYMPTASHLEGSFDTDWGNGFPDDRLLLLIKGQPLIREQVPRTLTIYAKRRLAHFLQLDDSTSVMSEQAIGIVKTFAGGDVEFFAIEMIADKPKFLPSPKYYYMNVLGRANRIDWSASTTEIQNVIKIEGSPPINVACWPTLPEDDLVMRARAEGDPQIWHERDVRVGDKEYRAIGEIFVSTSIWGQLNEAFPRQLEPRRVKRFV